MTRLQISVVDQPETFGGYGRIRLIFQSKKGYREAVNGVFVATLDRKTNRKGEEHWAGDDVHFHGDGRRFIYLQWLGESGQMFRRIKLYLDQIPGLEPGIESVNVKIAGRMPKDGSPACSTARIV